MSVPRIIVALDTDGPESAWDMAQRLKGEADMVKLGPVVLSKDKSDLVGRIKALGLRLFVDLKFHDIPHTVARAVEGWSQRGADFLTVHAQGGPLMLKEAAQAAGDRSQVLAVTVLTSLDQQALSAMGWPDSGPGLEDLVARWGRMAMDAGVSGLVCSLKEAPRLRKEVGPQALLVCPGLRPASSGADDQARTAGPKEAASSGADYLVVGRPVIRAADPVGALRELKEDLRG